MKLEEATLYTRTLVITTYNKSCFKQKTEKTNDTYVLDNEIGLMIRLLLVYYMTVTGNPMFTPNNVLFLQHNLLFLHYNMVVWPFFAHLKQMSYCNLDFASWTHEVHGAPPANRWRNSCCVRFVLPTVQCHASQNLPGGKPAHVDLSQLCSINSGTVELTLANLNFD